MLTQPCLALCNPIDCTPPGSSVHGILQARILEWVAMPSSRGSSHPRYQTLDSCISCIGRKRLYHWTKAAQTAGQLMRSLSRLVFVLLLPFMSLYFPVPPEYHLSLHILLSSARPLGYISLSCTEDIQPEHGSSFCNPCHSHFWCFSSLNSFTVEIETIYSGNLDSILMTSSVNC